MAARAERFLGALQSAFAGCFAGMMCIDLSFDLPVLMGGGQEDDLIVRSMAVRPSV